MHRGPVGERVRVTAGGEAAVEIVQQAANEAVLVSVVPIMGDRVGAGPELGPELKAVGVPNPYGQGEGQDGGVRQSRFLVCYSGAHFLDGRTYCFWGTNIDSFLDCRKNSDGYNIRDKYTTSC